jgi:hypothetical protein
MELEADNGLRLDGLNKEINEWDTGYYGHIYNTQCHLQRMTELQWPARRLNLIVMRIMER